MKKKLLLFSVFFISLYAKDNLITDMCKGIGYYDKYNCDMQVVEKAIKQGVDKIAKDNNGNAINFMKADAYLNEGKYYAFSGKLLVRLSENEALFYTEDNKLLFVYLEDLPSNIRFIPGYKYEGFVKGEGEYKYSDSEYEYTMIPKGTIISISQVN